MRLRFSVVILVLISFLNIGAFSESTVDNSISFNQLESKCVNMSEFIENGVKVQYKTKKDKDTEEKRVKEYFLQCNSNLNSPNNLEFYNDKISVETNLWSDGLYTYVNVTLINQDIHYMTLKLQNIIKNLMDKDSEEIQFFSYYKGKVDEAGQINSKKILDEIMSESKINEADILEVYNGYVGNTVIKNNEKLNFAISNYDTGTYIIIATPIIFTAY